MRGKGSRLIVVRMYEILLRFQESQNDSSAICPILVSRGRQHRMYNTYKGFLTINKQIPKSIPGVSLFQTPFSMPLFRSKYHAGHVVFQNTIPMLFPVKMFFEILFGRNKCAFSVLFIAYPLI